MKITITNLLLCFLLLACGEKVFEFTEKDTSSMFGNKDPEPQEEGHEPYDEAATAVNPSEPDPEIVPEEAPSTVVPEIEAVEPVDNKPEVPPEEKEQQEIVLEAPPVKPVEEVEEELPPSKEELPPAEKQDDVPKLYINLESGIKGGHFDVDTFYNNGSISHEHEFDEDKNTNGIVYYGAGDEETKKENLELRISADRFKIQLQNADLSENGYLRINNVGYNHENMPDSEIIYTLKESDDPKVIQLTDLTVLYSVNAIIDRETNPNSMRAIDPKCSKENKKGPNDSRRGGALTVVITDESGKTIWESSTYQHLKRSCDSI